MVKMVKENRIFVFMSLTILYSMEFINYRESSINDVLQNKKENKQSCFFFVTYLTYCLLLQCKGERSVYWLIQRDDEHNNKTIDLLYSTVYLWVVLCYVETIKDKPAVSYPVCFFFTLKTTPLSLLSLLKQKKNQTMIIVRKKPLLGVKYSPNSSATWKVYSKKVFLIHPNSEGCLFLRILKRWDLFNPAL